MASNKRLLFRAALPTGLVALFCGWLGSGESAPRAALIVAAAFATVSIARTVSWSRGFAARELVSTPEHLVLCIRGEAEQWVSWSDVTHLEIVRSDLLPEWSRSRTDWFHVVPHPQVAVMPPTALITGFRDMLISSAGSQAAADRVRAVAQARGIRCEE
ncbi:hypothetical protein UB45_10880 [Terrabacter sp. 28]|nr:hypothetical protein UB45_10880 [Terrabacter sp. 28]